MRTSVVEIVSQEMMDKIYKWCKHQQNQNIGGGNSLKMDKIYKW